jgi:hypothetical protein
MVYPLQARLRTPAGRAHPWVFVERNGFWLHTGNEEEHSSIPESLVMFQRIDVAFKPFRPCGASSVKGIGSAFGALPFVTIM